MADDVSDTGTFERGLHVLACVLAAATLTLGIVVLFGWHTGNRTLVQVLPQFVPMQYNTALGFVFGGTALLARCLDHRGTAIVAGSLAFIVGALTLVEYIGRLDLGIDELFMEHEVTVKTSHPGRMAPNTAACFALIGLALAWPARNSLQDQRSLLRISLASLAFGLSTVALAGYLTGLETAYGWGNLTRMALHTSIGFILASIGMICLTWSRESSHQARLPAWMPVPIAIAVLTATLCFWQALAAENARIQQQYAELTSLSLLATLMLVVGCLLAVAMAAAAHLAQKSGQRARQVSRANELLQAHRDNLETVVAERTRELETARMAAESANRAKSTFLANMSHELRTPLNAIIGYSEMLAEDLEDGGNPDQVADLRKIHGSGRHLLALINDILDLSKVEAGRMDLYLESFDVGEMIRDVVATVEPLVAKNSNRLETNLGDNLGTVRADLTKVRQSLFNLLSNAAKFTREGTITLSAGRETKADGDRIFMTVADSGIGIPEEKLGKIFEEFSQADLSTTRDYGGTGLGLSITRRFCQMMGGDVTVTSKPGEGSSFTIELPAHVDAREAARSGIAEADNKESPAPLPIGGVLVIDDDADARELLRRALESDGHAVRTAASGSEGLALARQMSPGVITLDVSMPEMDGWAVLRELKADPDLCHIPVVMASILQDQGLGYALGAAEYVTKPVDKQLLLKLVRQLMPGNQPGRILIIDDDPNDRELIRRSLDQLGWEVVEAENGFVGLVRVVEQLPDLIVLDLMMPVMNGFEFLQELRNSERSRDVPVLVLTAKELSSAERDLLSQDVAQVMIKDAAQLDNVLVQIRSAVETHLDR